MEDLRLYPKEEIQTASRNEAQRLKFYESSTGPYVSVLIAGQGLRLDHEQVVELWRWLGEWLADAS